MSFLTINGYPLSVAEGTAKVALVPIGDDKGRRFSGRKGGDVRALKRLITGRTSPLVPDDAKLVRALLDGEFDTLSFDGVTCSGKGVVASAGSGAYEPWYAADGARVVGPSLRGYGRALWGTAAATNLLSANQRDVETDTTGFSTDATCTISASTDRAWHGTKSLKVVVAGVANPHVYATASITPGAGNYTGSVYLTGLGNVYVRAVNLTNAHNGTLSATVALDPGKWIRLSSTVVVDAGGAQDVAIIVYSSANTTFYADGWSISKSDCEVPWGDPTTSPLVVPTYSAPQLVTDEFSILGQVYIPPDASADYPTAYLLEIAQAATLGWTNSVIALYSTHLANTINFIVQINGAWTTVGTSPAQATGVWIPWAITYSPQSTATRDKCQFFIGAGTGSSFMHANPTLVLPASVYTNLMISPVNKLVDDYLILRHALTQAQYVALVAGYDALLPAPQLRCKGDLVAAELPYPSADPVSMAARGLVKDERGVCGYVAGVYHNDLAVLDFTLEEV
jgi:hypothetical protein